MLILFYLSIQNSIMSCLNNNSIIIVSDELINCICHSSVIQRMAINSALNKRTYSGDRVSITPTTLTDIAAKLAMLRWNDQVACVKEYIRDLLGHGFPTNLTRGMNITPTMIESIPS